MEPETLQAERIEVRVLRVFGIGSDLIEPGTVIEVSRTRGEYLKFLGLVETI